MDKRQVEKAQSMLYIGNCYKYLGDEDSSKYRYIKSRETEPNRREPLIALAQLYFAKKKYQQVITYCLGALEIKKPTNFYSNLMSNYREVPHELLYIAYWWVGDKEKSKEHYDLAVSFNPTKQKYLNDRKFYYQD
jgi:tetratricopeptide (TPR) repeat protein